MNDPKLRPHTLVLLNQGDYTHMAELIGYPLPGGTIMVRRIPGHPGTLQEVRIAHLQSLDTQHKRRWVHYASVEGRGYFPIDMLRREYAAPVNFDPETTARLSGHSEDLLLVAKVTERRDPMWNNARWESFSWQLTALKSELYVPGQD